MRETTSRAARPEAPPLPAGGRRDPRIDLLRGFALMMIFFDHIPNDCLSQLTLQCFGFSDAAEMFVLLAGISAVVAYAPAVERKGMGAALHRIASRCLVIWGAHAGLLIGTAAILLARQWITGTAPTFMGSMLEGGFSGIVRGMSLQALPKYLDILPLYIVLLLVFPVILAGLRISVPLTIAASFAIYAVAHLTHANLPNHIDPRAEASWSFNPLAWQLVFVLGAALSFKARQGAGWLVAPPAALILACWAYLIFAFLAADRSRLWHSPLSDVWSVPVFGNGSKSFATPWRVLHGLALLLVLLTSTRVSRIARWPSLEPVRACGRHSLAVFSAGCMLALLGRIAFRDLGEGPAVQIMVNVTGVVGMLSLGTLLEQRRSTQQVETYAAPLAVGLGQGR